MIALDIKDLTCGYDHYCKTDKLKKQGDNLANSNLILSKLSLSMEDGEILCLLGKSGCGKSTLLKAIAGLLKPFSGRVELNGNVVSSADTVIPPECRRVGMIFQDYALFPHLTVFENIAFGLSGQTSKEIKNRVHEMLDLVELSDFKNRYPHEISGGQQQRVAISRALANKPSILLLDEPFSNIDSQVRQQLIRGIRDILKQQKVASLLVTHSRDEGFAFADTIAVMGNGKIMQKGTAFDVYHRPESHSVATFMGEGNLLPAIIEDEYHVNTPLGLVESTFSIFEKPALLGKIGSKEIELFIRPQMIEITAVEREQDSVVSGGRKLYLKGTVARQQFMGKTIRSEIYLNRDGNDYWLICEHSNQLDENTSVQVKFIPHDLILFDNLPLSK